MTFPRILLLCSLFLPFVGCGSPDAPPNFATAQPLSFPSYEHLYSSQTYSCIWYAGSDSDYHYYVMEHWTINPDKTDGHMTGRDLYKIPYGDINIDNPFPLTTDHDKWVLKYPTKLDQVQ